MNRRKKRRSTGGILSNVDLSLTEKDRHEGEKEERNLEVFEKWDSKDTSKDFRGVFAAGKDNLVSETQDKMDLAAVLRAKNSGEAVIPTFYHMEGDFWILDDVHHDAVMSGYLCENCLEWQAVPNAPRCNTNIPSFPSCGYERPLY